MNKPAPFHPPRRAARLLALAAALASALPPSAALAHDGAKLYAQRCVACHSAGRMAELVQRLGPDDAVRQRLQALLPRHHAPDDADREAIIQHVLSLRPPQ